MILNDVVLTEWGFNGGLTPFKPEHVNPASIDLTIGPKFIDLGLELECTMERTGQVTIMPGHAILASTKEFICMPEDCAEVLYLKSSLARQGLDHALAGWIDPGFRGELTLELHSHRLIVLKLEQRICQIALNRMEALPARSYLETGRYNYQTGPTEAR